MNKERSIRAAVEMACDYKRRLEGLSEMYEDLLDELAAHKRRINDLEVELAARDGAL